MEMVKVDIQKLQLLNDRIAQTIDALNQLRLSVHGIHHSPFTPYGYPSAPFGYPQQFAPQQFATLPYPPQQFATPYGTPFVASPFGGSQHTQVPSQVWPTPFSGNGISHSSWDPSWLRSTQTWPFYPVTLS